MPAPQEPRSPRPETEYTWQGDWARPTPPPEQPPRPAPTDRQRRQAARRRREMRRRRRRAAFLGTAAGILVLSGIITLILPKSVKGETEPEAPAVTGTTLRGHQQQRYQRHRADSQLGHRRPAAAKRRYRLHLHRHTAKICAVGRVWPREHQLVCRCRFPG